MTPQERDLITALLSRLKQQGGQPKDSDADALIRQAMAAQPDAPYLLVQTVLIQDMALNEAQSRIAALEKQLAEGAAPAAAPPQQAPSFLPRRGSVPEAGGGVRSDAAAAAPRPGWTQSVAGGASAAPAAPSAAPQWLGGGGSGFLRQAASTAAGVAGGALLFDGIRSLFGPHWGGGFLGGVPAQQPGLSETVINNYYGDQPAPDVQSADAASDPGQDQARDQDFAQQDDGQGQDTDFADTGADDGGFGGDDQFDV